MKLLPLLLLSLISSSLCKRTKKSTPSSCTRDLSFLPSPSSMTFLHSILNPIPFEDFFDNHFQKKAASAQRPNMPGYYGPMTSFEDVEVAIEKGFQVSHPTKRIVYGKDWKLAKRVVRDDDYWTGVYKAQGQEEIGVEEALAAFSQGFTLIMNGVQSTIPNVYQACWQLETALGWHVNVNLYVSPPGGSQGFEAHLDWMDGFIFQIAGTKRWKVYEPSLVSYPRPDLVRKPPMSFLETDSVESDLMMRAGDLAYIPRGIVHQAHTSPDDINGDGTDPYQQPSMHLTFGIELGKDASVEALLHHYIGVVEPQVFAALSESVASTSSKSSSPKHSLFESDGGRISFECANGNNIDGNTRGIKSSTNEDNAAGCTQGDILHLLLAAIAGYISEDEEAFVNGGFFEPKHNLSTASLRKAVGVTTNTTALPSLDPRLLLPQGLDVFSEGIKQLGVSHLIHFLIERKMVTITSVPSSPTCADYENIEEEDKNADVIPAVPETLYPSSTSSRNFTTLGSDFTTSYIDSFFSKSFKAKSSRFLDLKIQVSNQTVWEHVVDDSHSNGSTEKHRSYNTNDLKNLISEELWTNLETSLSDFVGRTLKDLSQARTGGYAESESKSFCDAFESMIGSLSADKKARKRSGRQALQNAGYEMNAV